MPVYSLDGNSIFEVAKRFERLGIQELNKTPQETRNNIRSGQDTGSSKWLTDFNQLYGLANQLKVKTTLQQADTSFLRQQLEAEYTQYKIDNVELGDTIKQIVGVNLEAETNMAGMKNVIDNAIEESNNIGSLMNRRYTIENTLDVWKGRFTGPTAGKKTREKLQSVLDFIIQQQMAIKLGSPDVAQQNIIYNTLSKTDSSLANLLQQLTPLTESLYNTFKSKLSQWTIEINSDLQEALKDDARVVRENFSRASASPEMSNYAVVFAKIQKNYNELNNLIQSMGSTTSDRMTNNLNTNIP
jgi:hypothetical protein